MTNIGKYKSKNPLLKIVLKRFLKEINHKLKKYKYKSLIDIGCGEGFVLQKFSPEGKVVGIDTSQEALKLAKKNFPRAIYKKANIYKIPFPKSSFDVALCLEVIEHLDNPDRGLKEVSRVAKNAIISVPESLVFRTLNLARLKNISLLGEDPEHMQRFTKTTFRKLLERYFKKVDISRSPPWLVGSVSR